MDEYVLYTNGINIRFTHRRKSDRQRVLGTNLFNSFNFSKKSEFSKNANHLLGFTARQVFLRELRAAIPLVEG